MYFLIYDKQKDRGNMIKKHTFETGRSMVEMLGVLAITGILSIGGVAGYSYAMNKYRANRIMSDVSLRAVDILSQLSRNQTPSLASWEKEDSIYPILLNTDYAPSQYYITVEDIPTDVCNIIAETMNSEVEILVDNENHVCAEGLNVLDFSFEGFNTQNDETSETRNCGTSNCNDCQICDIATQTCVNKPDNESKCIASEGKYGWCISGSCQPDTCNCNSTQYCADNAESCKSPSPGTTCSTPSYTPHTITFTDENGVSRTETWYALDTTVNYWDAQNACAAMGGEMPSDPSVFVLDWNGGTGAHSPNKRKEALTADGVKGAMWTAKVADDSCGAYYVLASSITTRYRNLKYNAVCKMP